MLGVPQFITSVPPAKDCWNDCAAYILPGGVEIARIWGKNLNQTLLEQGQFDNADVLLINNAPGIVLHFDSPINDTLFEAQDCELYGPIRGDAIYICIQPSQNGGAVVGE